MTKPGYKTTEFWLTLLAQVAGLAVAVLGVIYGEAHVAVMIAGCVVAVLANLGYNAGRAKVKAGGALAITNIAEPISSAALRPFNDNPQAIVADVLPEAPQLG